MNVAGVDLEDARPIGGGDICRAFRATTRDGREVFAKTLPQPPADFFPAEARGLDFIGVGGAPPTPAVVAVAADGIVLEWVESGPPTSEAAE